MKYPKILNLLDSVTNITPKYIIFFFWVEIDNNRKTRNYDQVKIKPTMLE